MPAPWKDNVGASDLAVGCFINGFFTTNALVDYSIDKWAASTSNHAFLAAYYAWRAEAPIISIIFAVLLIPLPFILFEVARGALASIFGWRRATPLRHAADLAQFVCFAFLLPYIITVVMPKQVALAEMDQAPSTKRAFLEARASAADAVLTPHLVVVLVNVLLLACDVAKYNGNAGPARLEGVFAAEADAAQKKAK